MWWQRGLFTYAAGESVQSQRKEPIRSLSAGEAGQRTAGEVEDHQAFEAKVSNVTWPKVPRPPIDSTTAITIR